MDDTQDKYPTSWAPLRHPWVRRELIEQLKDLSVADPRPIWEQERQNGRVAGIEQTIHFLFDDHEFDEADIGYSLFDTAETRALSSVKSALDPLIAALPDGQDTEYVSHPFWPQVTAAAAAAHSLLSRRQVR